MSKPNRVVLGSVGLGLVAILVTSVSYRLSHSSLVKPTQIAASQAPAGSATSSAAPSGMDDMSGMPENMPPAMAEALAKQAKEKGMSGAAGEKSMDGDAMRAQMGASMGGQDENQAGAVLDLMKRLQAEPDNVDVLLALADEFMDKSPESAQGFINRALVAAPGDSRPAYRQGVLLARQEKFKEAAEAMEGSLGMADDPSARYSLGVIYRYHLNQPDKAAQQFDAALKNPQLPSELRPLLEKETAK